MKRPIVIGVGLAFVILGWRIAVDVLREMQNTSLFYDPYERPQRDSYLDDLYADPRAGQTTTASP